jgi:hypothetical protein
MSRRLGDRFSPKVGQALAADLGVQALAALCFAKLGATVFVEPVSPRR